VRIHHDGRRGARAPAAHGLLQDLLGVRLDLVVDRQAHAGAGRLGLRLDDVERPPERVLHDRLAARLPAQRALERALEPLQADVVEPGVAQDLSCHRPLWVVAKLLGIEAESGEAQSLEVLRLVGIGLPRHVDEAARAVREQRIELRRVETELLCGSEGEVTRPVHLPRVRVDGGREPPDRERLAVAIDDRPPRGRYDDGLAVLSERHRCIFRPLDDLDPGSPRERGTEKNEERRCQNGDAAVRRGVLHRFSGM
jgi:hypothetical protein